MAFGSIWKFGADNSEYKKAVREMPSEMDKSARQIESRTKEMGSKMSGAMREFTGILVGGMALAGLKSLMNDFDKVAKVATRFGASAEEIQRVSVAADLAGTSIDTVARVLTKLSVSASDAATGNKAMADSFAKAGINADKFKNAGLDQQLIQLSEAFNRARGDADATNQIIELMGTRAASQMIPLIDNTAALRAEMGNVAVASDDVVRKIEAANDRLTRLGNTGKVAFAMLLEGIVNTSERLGSLIDDFSNIFKLSTAASLALTGNIQPLWMLLQTGKTIKEMEEIELRAQAIAQLTREGLLTGSDSQNSALIAERMEQIRRTLEGTKTVITDINDDLDNTLAVEKEKTAELERQQRALESQEASRQKALRSVEQEVALIEARLRGDKAGEARLLEDADFQSALERTGSFEAASNFAATRAAERRAKGGPSAGTAGALEADRDPTDNERVGALRGDFRARQAEQRAAALQDRNMFRSSIAAENRAQRRRDRAMESARLRDTFEETYGASNFGEAFREYQKETPFGQRLTEDQFKKFHEDMAKTPEERAREEAQRQKQGGAGDQKKDPASAMDDILKLLKKHVPKIDEKLPQHALV
jgi:hypothetical protein